MKEMSGGSGVPCPSLRAVCASGLKSYRVNLALVCLLFLGLGLWTLSRQDCTNTPFALPLAKDRVFRQKSDGFRENTINGWSAWIERPEPRQDGQKNEVTWFSKTNSNKMEGSVSSETSTDQSKGSKLATQRNTNTELSLSGENTSQKLPAAIIIGVRKGGTLALLRYLSAHPQIRCAKSEVHFFDLYYDKGFRWYRHQMPLSTPGQVTMEKTPKYFVTEMAPKHIHRMNSSVRLILTLRNPINRAISDYVQLRLTPNFPNRTFSDLIIDSETHSVKEKYKIIDTSTYHVHLSRWLQYFPLKQIHIVDGDRLIAEPLEELKGIETFLGVSKFFSEDVVYFNASRGFYCVRRPSQNGDHLPACLGDSKGREHPFVESWVRKKLFDYFYPHNEKLFRMIGHRFDWT